jgi:5'-3' exonuclease
MGVPAFFRNLVKKYKIIRNNPDKPIKALYIDANCLFHPQCFKILDKNIDVRDQQTLFKKMSDRIIAYIDYLIRLTNPSHLVYIAVDGVAPRAKMNQQRLRRFGYANNYRHDVYRKYGIKFNDSWSNIVITPGTQFMYDLHLKLKNHYKRHVKSITDPMCKYEIIYDSYMTPGEGEHKILQHIKNHSTPDFENATIIYGLDADLIFLSMASQYPNIYLLRETSQFSKNDDSENFSDSIEEELCFADIDFAKDSINNEFNEYYRCFINENINQNIFNDNCQNDNVVDTAINRFDFINDYIFICYFLGNDFLPHLPSIDINVNGLDIIFNVYMDIFQVMGKNMICFQKGKVFIDNEFLREFISKLASKEEDYFRRLLPDHLQKHYHRKCFESDSHKKEIWKIENLKNIRIYDPIKLGYDEAHDWKYRYYSHYFNTEEHMSETIGNVCHNYIEGLLWVARYYFEKCPTWNWQYKFTHAPFLSDIMIYLKYKNITEDFEVKYADPVDIFTQLVSVVPSAYSYILPKSLQYLCSSVESPIIDMFPLTYKIDMINKTQLYKCVPMIPYLDMDRVHNIVKQISVDESDNIKIQRIKAIHLGKCNS